MSDVADMHVEVADPTRFKSIEDGIYYTTANMKEVIKQEATVNVGKYQGYEVIGTVCVQWCKYPQNAKYAPFSVIYFSDGKYLFKVKYSEGILGKGWKENMEDWKYYSEFKDTLSTFVSNIST